MQWTTGITKTTGMRPNLIDFMESETLYHNYTDHGPSPTDMGLSSTDTADVMAPKLGESSKRSSFQQALHDSIEELDHRELEDLSSMHQELNAMLDVTVKTHHLLGTLLSWYVICFYRIL